MKSYEFKNVKITVEDFGCEVTFSDTKRNSGRPFDDEHYIMFQYFEDDDYESESNFCYIESDDFSITGHYKKLNAKLFRDTLFIDLKKHGKFTIKFEITDSKHKELKQVLEALFSGLGKFEVFY